MTKKFQKIVMVGDIDLSTFNACRIHFLSLAEEFSRMSMQVSVILPRPAKDAGLSDQNYKTFFTRGYWRKNHFLRAFFTYPFFLPLCAKEFFDNPDIFYFRITPLMILPIGFLKILRRIFNKPQIKIVGEINGWLEEEIKTVKAGKIKKILEIFAFKQGTVSVDCLRVVTPELGKLCELRYGMPLEKIFVVGNGTSIEKFKPIDKRTARKKLSINDEDFLIGFIGKLFSWQGVAYLLESLPLILKKIPEAKLLIVGDGPEMPALKDKVKQLNIAEKCVFSGTVSPAMVPLYINSFDVAVAPFTEERMECGTSALKMYEYMACAAVIVVSRIKNFKFLEKECAGILVEAENTNELAAAIIKLHEDPRQMLAMGRNARKLAKDNFSWSRIASRIIDSIEKRD